MRFLSISLLFLPYLLFGQTPKFTGVNLSSAEFKAQKDSGIPPLENIGAEWISLIPFAYMDSNTSPKINFPSERNWWADKPNNLKSVIKDARKFDKKIMLKPHFWVEGSGWAGSLKFDSIGWVQFENNYRQFIMRWAIYAEIQNIEMFCFATELKTVVKKRPEFFRKIIKQIRQVYHGSLVYASNWDDYHRFPFWHELDYIGVDAYFPISESITPTPEEIHEKWKPIALELARFAVKKRKMIIFTEYGYQSINKPTWKQWESEYIYDAINPNLEAQKNGYEGLYRAVWNQPWFAGGFIWKWYPEPVHFTGRIDNSDYTPQNKPAEKTIYKWYKNNGK